jgi:hypothetical protein
MEDDTDRVMRNRMRDAWEDEVDVVRAILGEEPRLEVDMGWNLRKAKESVRGEQGAVLIGRDIVVVSKGGTGIMCAPGLRWVDGAWSDEKGIVGVAFTPASPEGLVAELLESYRDRINKAHADPKNFAKIRLEKLLDPHHVEEPLHNLYEVIDSIPEEDGWVIRRGEVHDIQFIHPPGYA